MSIALIVMYMQKHFCSEALRETMESISEKINYSIDLFRENSKRIIWVQDEKDKHGNIMNPKGFEIIDFLKPEENEKRIIQYHKKSFYETELMEYLYTEKVNTIIVTGYYPLDCIFTTRTRHKGMLDYELTPYFLKDAIAGNKKFLSVLEMISKTITIEEMEKILNNN